MIKTTYSNILVPNGFRLLKEGEEISKDDIYYAEISGIPTNKLESWRKCTKKSIGKKFLATRFMPVAKRV